MHLPIQFPLHVLNKRFSLIGLLFLSYSALYASEKKDLPVMPSVIQGICSVCNTTSCSTCPKVAAVRRARNAQEEAACSSCENAGDFCTDDHSKFFIDSQIARNRCTEEKRCRLGCLPPFSAFIPRSQGTNTARELAGWEEFIHQFDAGYYLTTGHVLGYYRSFRPERLAKELFGETVLRFAGSQVENRGRCALLADNFGLSPEFKGKLTIHPVIENIIFDNQFFLGLDPLLYGLYVRVHMPIVHTRWNLDLCQHDDEESSCPDFPACYMSEEAAPATCDILTALNGNFLFGDMQTPWKYGRIINGVQTKTGVADLDFIVGYDICRSDTSHYGFFGQLVFPTGNKLTGRQLFQPLVGNAKHFELGAGFSGHMVLLEHDAESNLAVWIVANVVHMFKNTQMRSFDFCHNGPLSRYMLLKELTEVDGQLQYTGNLINGINFATRPVDVSVAAKGDVSAKLAVRTPRIIADLGYNFYGRTAERVRFKKCVDDRIFAIKGTEGVCGLEYETEELMFGPFVGNVPLNSSQDNATIRRGALTDNPQPAPKQNLSDIVVTAFSRQEGSTEGPDVIRAFVSRPPRIVTVNDLHKETGTMPAQATHKVFGYLGYNFYEHDWCANPYLGLGGEVEFDARSVEERSALNQWSIWIKGGFEF